MVTFFRTRRPGRSQQKRNKSGPGGSKLNGKMFFFAGRAHSGAARSVAFPDIMRRAKFWKSLGKRRQADLEKMLNTLNCNATRANMNKTILLAAALAPSLLFAQTPSPRPDKPVPVKQYTIEQFMATTRVGGATFSPDEKSILFHSNKSGIFNVYTTPVSGGEQKQLTDSTREETKTSTSI